MVKSVQVDGQIDRMPVQSSLIFAGKAGETCQGQTLKLITK